ncbi:hypothetical protein D3C74_481340 [compost metagenome]
MYMLKVPYFELLATSTTCEADCIAACLTSTFSAEGVVRPRRRSHELVDMNAISVTTWRKVATARPPTHD